MISPRSAARRIASLLLLALLGGCGDFYFDPAASGDGADGPVRIALGTTFEPAAVAAFPGLGEVFDRTDRVGIRVFSVADGALLHQGTHVVTPDSEGIRLELPIALPGPTLRVRLELRLLEGSALLFEGELELELERGRPAEAPVPIAPVADGIEIEGPTSFSRIGETAEFSAVPVFANGQPFPGISLAWSALDPSIVAVTAGGTATSRAEGEARLVVEGGGLADTVRISVRIPAATVRVTPDSLDLLVGTTGSLQARVLDADGAPLERTVTWRSSAPEIAAVSQSGAVQGLAEGTARIVAEAEGVSAEARVRVRTRAPSSAISLGADEILARSALLSGRLVATAAISGRTRFEVSTDPAFAQPLRTPDVPFTQPEGERGYTAPITGLEPETRYLVRFVVETDDGERLVGEPSTFTTLREVTAVVPEAPRRLNLFALLRGSTSSRSFGGYHISWTDVPEGTEYLEVLRRTAPAYSEGSPEEDSVWHRLAANQTFFRDSDFPPTWPATEFPFSLVTAPGGDTIRYEMLDLLIWYGIRACNEAGCSDFTVYQRSAGDPYQFDLRFNWLGFGGDFPYPAQGWIPGYWCQYSQFGWYGSQSPGPWCPASGILIDPLNGD